MRTNSIKKERDQSRINAKKLFPNNPKRQQEYINYIHDHGGTKEGGRNKRCVWSINEEYARLRKDLTIEEKNYVFKRLLEAGLI